MRKREVEVIADHSAHMPLYKFSGDHPFRRFCVRMHNLEKGLLRLARREPDRFHKAWPGKRDPLPAKEKPFEVYRG
jgi:hypothetical protein